MADLADDNDPELDSDDASLTLDRDPSQRERRRERRRTAERVVLLTGYPDFVCGRLLRHILVTDPGAFVYVLVHAKYESEARRDIKRLGERAGDSAQVLVGDVVDMDLGLSGSEVNRVLRETTDVFHLAAVTNPAVSADRTQLVNVTGTRNLLDLGRHMKRLRRFNHFSTCFVSGDRVGVISEDELDEGQRFRNAFEETKFRSELDVRAAGRDGLPVCVLRPSLVVGDSTTGEIDRFDGIYYMGIALVAAPLQVPFPIPLPANGVAPLNVAPVDYVVEASYAIGTHPDSNGKTFHVADPCPLSARRVYELVGEMMGRRLRHVHLPGRTTRLFTRLLEIPGLEKLTRRERQAIEYVNHIAFYRTTNTLRVLGARGIQCPPMESYLPTLVAYVKKRYEERNRAAEEAAVHDPFE